MKYETTVVLKNGETVWIRNGTEADGREAYAVFNQAHAETDFLLTYPDENRFSPEEEAAFLANKTNSIHEVELLAVMNGKIVGTAGIEAIGSQEKIRHRASFGISVLKDYWGLGIGTALTEACLACARTAGYTQVELDVVADNAAAIRLYRRLGFTEYGRNPRGFCSRMNGYQELVLMRAEIGKQIPPRERE